MPVIVNSRLKALVIHHHRCVTGALPLTGGILKAWIHLLWHVHHWHHHWNGLWRLVEHRVTLERLVSHLLQLLLMLILLLLLILGKGWLWLGDVVVSGIHWDLGSKTVSLDKGFLRALIVFFFSMMLSFLSHLLLFFDFSFLHFLIISSLLLAFSLLGFLALFFFLIIRELPIMFRHLFIIDVACIAPLLSHDQGQLGIYHL